jgi:deoxyribonuclease-2
MLLLFSKGRIFGQTMLCMTLNASGSLLNNSIDLLSTHFLFTRPFVFASGLTSFATKRYSILSTGIIPNKAHITTPPYTYFHSLNSSSLEILTFAKYGLANIDILGEFIVPSLRTSMLSETWSNGGQTNLPSNCTGLYHTENIEKLSFNFTVHQDHSKWLVSRKDSWICIGDMNRQLEQKRRHGGFACLKNQYIQQRFEQLVQKIESCPSLKINQMTK